MSVPSSDIAGPSSTPATKKEVGPTLSGASSGAALVEEVFNQKDTLASAPPPSWNEMMEMLKHDTNVEPLFTKMSDFFPLTKQISLNLGSDPPVFVSVGLPFGTLESIVSRIQQLQDCTVQETTEVVTSSILPSFHMHTSLIGTNPVSIISSSWWLASITWCISAHYFLSGWR